MKKAFLRAGLLLMIILVCFSCKGKADTKRKLTIMIYMCGSNLESGSGAASRDLEEIKAAGFSPEVTVLAMTGGSKGNGTYYSDSTTRIHEIASGRSRCVWQSGSPVNMGDRDTLTHLLRFGTREFPAEEYALILWNHGGGPLEGVCWDELFSLDHLSLSEITEGIRWAELPRKLKWIGFDACLMSSLEVAEALSPYAEYMIASQETEPSYGWNYAFLRGIENDVSGAETGRRIIDLYFDGRENTGDVLTLACLDLSKAEGVSEAMNAAFSELEAEVDEDHFSRLSGIRMGATGFGKSVRAAGEGGYDLVDALDLVQRMNHSYDSFSALEEKLNGMIVFSRSSEEGAHGISLYHPYTNKADFLGKWEKEYYHLGFCPGYSQYIRAFGEILTGVNLTDWRNLRTENLGSNRFAVQLTPEQAENFGSAQLFIFAGGFSTMGKPDHCLLVYSGSAEMNKDGMIEATWPERMLFAEKENGELVGPVTFLLTDDARYQVATLVYTPVGKIELNDSVNVRYYLQEQPGDLEPVIVQTRVLSDVTGTYTNRESFSEDGYHLVHLWHYFRIAPDFEKTDPLPAFADWPVDNIFNKTTLSLPQNWKFRYVDGFSSGEQYFAMFQITDTQQNIYSTRPVIINNPNLTRMTSKEGALETENIQVSLSAYWDESPIDPGLQLFLELTNLSDIPVRLDLSDFVINETQLTDKQELYLPCDPGKTISKRIDLPKDILLLQETVRSVSFSVSGKNEAGEIVSSARFQFSFDEARNPGWNGSPVVLARTEQDGILWELLKAERNGKDNLILTVHISNQSRAEYSFPSGFDTEINHLLLESLPSDDPNSLQPGQEAVIRVQITNYCEAPQLFNDLRVEGYDDFVSMRFAKCLLQSEGITEIRRIAFVHPDNYTYLLLPPSLWDMNSERKKIVFELDAPVSLDYSDVFSGPNGLLLAENDRFSLRVHRLLIGNNGAEICLRAENRAEEDIIFEIGNLEINGLSASASEREPKEPFWFVLSSGMTTWISRSFVTVEAPEKGTELEKISFTVRINDEDEAVPVTIYTKSSATFGETGGFMLEADQMEAAYSDP